MAQDRIVVGIDFSEPSLQAARWTARQFEKSELVLAHVIALPDPPPIVSHRYPPRELLMETVRIGAQQQLHDLARSLGSVLVWPEIREGPAAATLAAIAADYDARFVVVGAHGNRPRVAGTLGTTAEQVVKELRLPVLLASRLDERPIARVLAAVDDEALALESLRWARAVAADDARVTTLHVTTGGVMSGMLSAAAVISGAPPAALPSAHASAPSERWIALAQTAGLDGGRLTNEEASGDAVTEILGLAERLDADLIVMGRRAAGGVRRVVLGSVTEGVLRHATRNVLVVPEPE